MVTKNILYLKKSNRSTIVKNLFQDEIEIDIMLDELLERVCLKDLTTLKGRIDAIKKVYHIHKYIPIYLTEDIILITVFNKKQIDNIYINTCNIIDMVKDNNKTIIVFLDRSQLIINKSYRLVKRYFDQSFKINKF